jgi:hypothetical protein
VTRAANVAHEVVQWLNSHVQRRSRGGGGGVAVAEGDWPRGGGERSSYGTVGWRSCGCGWIEVNMEQCMKVGWLRLEMEFNAESFFLA